MVKEGNFATSGNLMMSREQAAVYLNVSITTLSRYYWSGDLPGFKVGKFLRFKKEDLDKFLAQPIVTKKA